MEKEKGETLEKGEKRKGGSGRGFYRSKREMAN